MHRGNPVDVDDWLGVFTGFVCRGPVAVPLGPGAGHTARGDGYMSYLRTSGTCRMSAMKTATIEETRAGLGDVVDRARIAGEPTLITRYGRPAAVVVSEDWYRLAEECLASRGEASR